MHICVGKLNITGSDNGLSPAWRQAVIWTSAGILLIRPSGTNFSDILIGTETFSLKKMYLNMLSAKWRPFCLSLNEFKSARGQWVSKWLTASACMGWTVKSSAAKKLLRKLRNIWHTLEKKRQKISAGTGVNCCVWTHWFLKPFIYVFLSHE